MLKDILKKLKPKTEKNPQQPRVGDKLNIP